MKTPVSLKLSDFDFDLPETLIATRPAVPRTASRLLVAGGQGAELRISDQNVHDLGAVLRPGDRLVLNNTKVIPARLAGTRHRHSEQGPVHAAIEVTLLAPAADVSQACWRALLKPLRKVKDGEVVAFEGGFEARVLGRSEGAALLEFNLVGAEFDAALALAGAMPLPPYIAAKRPADARDMTDYQTVFARHKGAVAAPTASLHFDTDLLKSIEKQGVDFSYVTLHVGAGTFLPVKTDDIRDHKMHSEWGEVSPQAAEEIRATRAAGGRIIPVGTTALRVLESAARDSGAIAPFSGDTDIFITPGFDFRVADGLMTNFHLPKSTLMMLVSALMGTGEIRRIYAHAISEGYRFFSYGDASILLPRSAP